MPSNLGVPTPTIDMAVMSSLPLGAQGRARGRRRPPRCKPAARMTGEEADVVRQLGAAVHAAFLVTYAQGFALLKRAS